MRPAVLMVDPDDERRRAVSQGLSRYAYDVVPASSPLEGLRFAQGLGPSVIVAPADLLGFGDGSILERFAVQDRTMRRTLLLLGERSADADEVPEDVLFLAVDGLSAREIVRRLRLVLVGREVGLEPDLELRSLVGDLALMPLLELLRALNRIQLSGTLRLQDGVLMLEEGQVIAARAGKASGVKAVCRLSRRKAGPFRLTLGATAAEREIELDFFDLMIRAIEEAQVVLPDPRARPRLDGNARLSGEFNRQERGLLEVVDRCETVGELLDALPASDGRIVEALNRLVERGVLRLHKPLAPVAVVTDSTGDLPPDLAAAHDVLVVPLSVIFGQHTFRDGVDIRARDFYQLLESEQAHPATRPPPDVEFVEHYTELLKHQDVVSVHISERLSETVAHARTAARVGASAIKLPPERERFALEVVDSKNVSMGLGLQALFAARMAMRQRPAREIAAWLRSIEKRIHLFFVVHTLEYLVRGGRLSKTRAAVGKLLGIKPILGVADGEVVPIDRVRGGRRAHPRIVQLLAQRIEPKKGIVLAVAHAKAPMWADRLGKLLKERFRVLELIETDIGPVVGTHTGPGCVGCVVFQPTAEEWPLIRPLDDGEE